MRARFQVFVEVILLSVAIFIHSSYLLFSTTRGAVGVLLLTSSWLR